MAEVSPTSRLRIVAAALLMSAIALFALAMMFYTGVIALPEGTGAVAGFAVGLVAAADLAIAVVFFRKGQSS